MEILETKHGRFTNNEDLGLSAQEVYKEWLENKDKLPLPTIEDRLKQAEDTILFLLTGGM